MEAIQCIPKIIDFQFKSGYVGQEACFIIGFVGRYSWRIVPFVVRSPFKLPCLSVIVSVCTALICPLVWAVFDLCYTGTLTVDPKWCCAMRVYIWLCECVRLFVRELSASGCNLTIERSSYVLSCLYVFSFFCPSVVASCSVWTAALSGDVLRRFKEVFLSRLRERQRRGPCVCSPPQGGLSFLLEQSMMPSPVLVTV